MAFLVFVKTREEGRRREGRLIRGEHRHMCVSEPHIYQSISAALNSRWVQCIRPVRLTHGEAMSCTVQCRPASARGIQSRPGGGCIQRNLVDRILQFDEISSPPDHAIATYRVAG